MTRVLVCGGRNYSDSVYLIDILDQLHAEFGFSRLAHGGARGADNFAGRWANLRRIPQQVYPADWARNGGSAGPIRNQHMLNDFQPDLVVAFPGGRGTAHMTAIARKAGITVREEHP